MVFVNMLLTELVYHIYCTCVYVGILALVLL